MIFSSMSSRLLYHLGENLVPVREAGDHVYVFTAVRLQLRRRGGDVRLDRDLFPGNVREGEPLRQIVAIPAGEDDPLHLGAFSWSKSMSHSQLVSLVKYFRLTASTITRTVQGSWAARM